MKCKWTTQELDEALTLNEQGVSIAALARKKGVSKASFYRLLRRRKMGFRLGFMWEKTIRMPTDPAQIGYIAGLFDGEGSISKIHNGPGTTQWMVRIGMTDKPTIDFLSTFGGTITFRSEKPPRKAVHTWSLSRQLDVQDFLQVLLPQLIVKKEKALAVLAEIAQRT